MANITFDDVKLSVAFTKASTRANITSQENISTSFGKIAKMYDDLKTVAFSGSFDDLTDKPTIDATVTQSSTNAVQSAAVYDFVNGSKMIILSYGNSTWDDFLDAYTKTRVVYCRASSNSNPATGSQTRMAFLAYVNDETNPTEGEFQYYRSISSHTDSTQGDEVYVYKINKTNGWSVQTRRVYTKVIAGTNLTSSFVTGANAAITLNHATSGVIAGTYDTVTVDAQGHATAGSNSRVSNVTYDTTNSPVLKETIGGTDSTIETPDTTPTDSSKHLITSGGVYSALADKITIDDVFGYGTAIEANSDLNDYTTPGSYFVLNNASAATITNKPMGGSGFRLIVRYVTNSARPRQEFIKSTSPEFIYVRNMTSDNTWSDWYKFDTVKDGLVTHVAELIDSGAKNRAAITDFTYTASSSGGWKTIPFFGKAGETLVVSANSITSTDTDGTTCELLCLQGNTETSNYYQINRGSNVFTEIQLNADTTTLRIYVADTYAHSANDTLTVSGLMICSKAQWDVSQAYQASSVDSSLINSGAKNYAKVADGSNTQYVVIPCRNIPPGTYRVAFGMVTSSDTAYSVCQLYIQGTKQDGTVGVVSTRGEVIRGINRVYSGEMTIKDGAVGTALWIYASNNLTNSAGKTVSFTDAMLCEASQFEVSSKFVPYSPTNAELADIIRSSTFAFGTCDTAADSYPKVVTISDANWTKTVGSIIAVKFTNTNTFSATADEKIKLSVNGVENEIYYNSAVSPTGTNTNIYGYANRYIYYVWDGTYWVWQGHGVDNNSTYTPQSLGCGYGTCSTAASTAAKTATLSGYSLVTNGIVAIRFTNAVPANATLNINSRGAKSIYYKGAAITADVIKAGDVVTFVYSGQYHIISIL